MKNTTCVQETLPKNLLQRNFSGEHWPKHLKKHGESHTLSDLGVNEALEHFDRAVRLYPDSARAHINKGNALT